MFRQIFAIMTCLGFAGTLVGDIFPSNDCVIANDEPEGTRELPLSDEVIAPLKRLVSERYRDSLLDVSATEFTAQYHCRQFLVYNGGRGPLPERPALDYGPDVDGFMVKVTHNKHKYQGASGVPYGIKRGLFWPRLVKEYALPNNGGVLRLEVEFGAAVPMSFLRSIHLILMTFGDSIDGEIKDGWKETLSRIEKPVSDVLKEMVPEAKCEIADGVLSCTFNVRYWDVYAIDNTGRAEPVPHKTVGPGVGGFIINIRRSPRLVRGQTILAFGATNNGYWREHVNTYESAYSAYADSDIRLEIQYGESPNFALFQRIHATLGGDAHGAQQSPFGTPKKVKP